MTPEQLRDEFYRAVKISPDQLVSPTETTQNIADYWIPKILQAQEDERKRLLAIIKDGKSKQHEKAQILDVIEAELTLPEFTHPIT